MGLFGNGLPKGAAATDYNTPLTPEQQAPYQQWQSKLPTDLRNTSDYDLQGAYLGGAMQSPNAHLPDTWKKPNHMTFSDGSQYSVPGMQGGQWGAVNEHANQWNYWASPANMQAHSPQQLMDYFKQVEPNSQVFLPYNYRLPQR